MKALSGIKGGDCFILVWFNLCLFLGLIRQALLTLLALKEHHCVFWLLFCCITQVHLSFRAQTDGRMALLQDFLIESRIHGYMGWWSYYKMLCSNHLNQPKKVTILSVILSVHRTEYFPKSFDHLRDVFYFLFHKCETSFCVLFGQQWCLPLNSLMNVILPPESLSYCWTLTLTMASEVFFLDELLMCSWSNCSSLATPGKVQHCPKFSWFGLLESQRLGNCFVKLSRLTDANDFKLRHDVLLFEIS